MAILDNHRNAPSHIIAGEEIAGTGEQSLQSINPFTGEIIWTGKEASPSEIEAAVASSNEAFSNWRGTAYEERKALVKRFTELVTENAEKLTSLVSIESGKPTWEARVEVNALVTKFEASADAYETRCAEFGREVKGRQSKTRFVPHGVMAVFGPFNFPLSMANGHIMPALLAGNTVIFKPSEQTTLCGLAVAQLWQDAGLPNGVLNCVSGGRAVGEALTIHANTHGVLFVGGHSAGMAILNSLISKPQKIVALEMGGNSPLIVHDVATDAEDAVSKIVIQSSFISGGQRCSAARRLIVNSKYSHFVEKLIADCKGIRVGDPVSGDEPPFYGPLISPKPAETALNRFHTLVEGGAKPLLEPTISGPNNTLMTPGILDVQDCINDADEEIFGPVLKVQWYDDDIDEAISLANATMYGLAAGIICSDRETYERAYNGIRSGIFNWNQPLTGATTFAPFGGVGHSGNFRPAGYLSCDYCSYAVASFESPMDGLSGPSLVGVG